MFRSPPRTHPGVELARAILATFRLNGALLESGDDPIRDLGVSSARWQVLGAVGSGPLPVAQIARDLGRKRQGVQPTVDRLEKQGLVEMREKPQPPAGEASRAAREAAPDWS